MLTGMLSGASVGRHTVEAYYSHSGDSHYTVDMDATTYVDVGSSDPATSAVYTYKIYQSDGSTPGFDANGNITAYYETTSGQWQNVQYDSLNRIIRADGPSGLAGGSPYFCWTYDIYGNRTQQNLGTSAFTASSGSCSGGGTVTTDGQTYDNNNRLIAADHPSATFTPDASGNLQNDDAHGYTYDADGHLCAMSTTILSVTTYRGYLYDASGIRIAQGTQNSMSCDLSSNGFTMTNMYVQGADGETMTETDGSGVWQHTDVGAGGLMATYDNVGLHFHATDWLGSRKAQTDYAGSLEHGYQYMPFGEIAGGSDSGATEKLFTGQEHDHYSGLDYFRARYLGASTGRFMSPDDGSDQDIANPQSWNLYSYVRNSPLNLTDPTGKNTQCSESYMLDASGNKIDTGADGCKWDNNTSTYDTGDYRFLLGTKGVRTGVSVTTGIALKPGGRQLDPSNQECKALAAKIGNIVADIQSSTSDLANNPLGLPDAPPFPGAPKRMSVQGHRELLDGKTQNLANRAHEYNQKCGGGDPFGGGAAATSRSAAPNPSPKVSTGTTRGLIVVGGAIIIVGGTAIICPECLALAPLYAY